MVVQVTVDPVAEAVGLSGRDRTAVPDSTPAQPDGRALGTLPQSDIPRQLCLRMMDTFPRGGSRFTNNLYD